MALYRVQARWSGAAETVIEATSPAAAEQVAYNDTWCAFEVKGGRIDFEVESVEPIEASDA